MLSRLSEQVIGGHYALVLGFDSPNLPFAEWEARLAPTLALHARMLCRAGQLRACATPAAKRAAHAGGATKVPHVIWVLQRRRESPISERPKRRQCRKSCAAMGVAAGLAAQPASRADGKGGGGGAQSRQSKVQGFFGPGVSAVIVEQADNAVQVSLISDGTAAGAIADDEVRRMLPCCDALQV